MSNQLLDFIERKSLGFALCIVFTSSLGILLMGGWFSLSYVPDVRGVEPNVIFSIQKVLSGKPLYTDPSDIPFDITQYSPFYYYLCATIARALGIVPGEVHKVYVVARSVSLVFSICWVFVSYAFMVRLLKVNRDLALISCGFIYVCSSPWNFLARPDCLTSLCVITSIALFVSSLDTEQYGDSFSLPLCLAALLGVVALCTKQNGAQVPFIFLSFLMFRREWKRFMVVAVTTAIPIILLLAFSEISFSLALKKNIVDGLRSGLNLRRAWWSIYYPFFTQMALIASVPVVVVLQWLRTGTRSREKFLAYTLIVFFVFASLTAVRLGSAIHCYIDFQTLSLICIASFLSPWWVGALVKAGGGRYLRLVVVVYTLIFLPIFSFGQFEYYRRHHHHDDKPWHSINEVVDFMRTEFELNPRTYFISSDVNLDNSLPNYCVAPQKELVSIAYRKRVFDYAKLIEAVKIGKVRYAVVQDGKWPFDSLLKPPYYHNFRLLKTIGKYSIHRFDD
jgi:hypothetical protein